MPRFQGIDRYQARASWHSYGPNPRHPPGPDRQRPEGGGLAHVAPREGGVRGRVAEASRRGPCLSHQETHPVGVWPLFVAVGYALRLSKNSLKNNHFLPARDGEDAGARHTHTHTRLLCRLLSRPSCSTAEAPAGAQTRRPLLTAPHRPAPRPPHTGPQRGRPRALLPRLPVGFCSQRPPPPRKTAHSGLGALAAAPVCPPGWEALALAQAWRCSRCRRPGKGPARRAPPHLPPGPSRRRRA